MKPASWMVATLLALLAPAAAASVTLHASGAVEREGPHVLPDSARLLDALKAVRPASTAWPVAGSLLRPSLVHTQTRLKAGLLYDLQRLQARHGEEITPLMEWVAALPVTGRLPVALDPRRLAADSQANVPLAPGDRLHAPLRPAHVMVVGAVHQPCRLDFRPLADLDAYLAQCPATRAADRDWVWLVQPDGRIFKRGRALWNRPVDSVHAAPGSWVVIGIDPSLPGMESDDLNDELAAFVATQWELMEP